MGTKVNPGKFNCYHNAEDDEPIFTLLARDVSAPTVVRLWAEMRMMLVRLKLKPESDREMCFEAMEIAEAMTKWRKANRP
jgi:hypothetical protein